MTTTNLSHCRDCGSDWAGDIDPDAVDDAQREMVLDGFSACCAAPILLPHAGPCEDHTDLPG